MTNQSQTTKHGDTLKCPACGAYVSRMSAKCPECGHEFSNVSANNTANSFLDELQRIDRIKISDDAKLKRKVQYIHNFPVPNTKEDLIEMINICHSNSESAAQDEELRKAWKAKTDQLIQKAKITLKGDKDAEQIIGAIQSEGEQKKKRKMIKIGSIVAGILLLCGVAQCQKSCHNSEARDINTQITTMKSDINKEINAGQYDAAFSHIDSLNNFMIINELSHSQFEKNTSDLYQNLVIALIREDDIEGAARVGLDYRTKLNNDYQWKKSAVYKVLIQECEARDIDDSPLQ